MIIMDKFERKQLQKEEKRKLEALAKKREIIHKDMVTQQNINLTQDKIAPEGVCISLQHVNKIYPNHIQAVYDFNLDIKENEFIVFVGPSGCGKSTTLRMIAGLEDITYGDLYISGKFANTLLPKSRDCAMVFQSYALYPNMTVYDNMAFSLKVRKVELNKLDKQGNQIYTYDVERVNALKAQLKGLAKDDPTRKTIEQQIETIKATLNIPVTYMGHYSSSEIHRRVMDAAKILELTDYLGRKPSDLSGGQRQRVALGRAIVRDAKVFLMDEPLSNLDAKLRVQMRSEIVSLHEKIGSTTVYVTHDQTEAMTMADRVVVMKDGYIQQIGTPKEIYNQPANIFVATFVGAPSMNLVNVKVSKNTITLPTGLNIKISKSQQNTLKKSLNDAISLLEKEIQLLLEQNQTLPDKLKRKDEIIALNLEEIDKKNELIKTYKTWLETGEFEAIMGVRPEDIVTKKNSTILEHVSEGFKGYIRYAELLGNEYCLYFNYGDLKQISKISANEEIESKTEVEFFINTDSIHLFDTLSTKRIF